MRGHGVPEWPDPNRDGSDPMRGTELGRIVAYGPVPQRLLDARDACTSIENELRNTR
jgi:hypothetical protein